MRPAAALAAVLLAGGPGCSAAGGPGEAGPRARVYEPEEVQRAPELVDCGDWIDHGESRVSFAVVQFVVTATGEVRDPRVVQAPARLPGIGLEAIRIARTCRYRPAMRAGEAVAVRWAKRFDFPEGGV